MIGVVFLVILSVAANYWLTRRRQKSSVRETAAVLSSDMMRSAEGFKYTDYRDGVRQFEIDARKLLETREGKSYLQGISANDFSSDKSIRNQIRSSTAVYDQKNKLVDFVGDVRLFLGRDFELRTDSLHYDLKSKIAATADSVEFYLGEGSGKARGIRFDEKKNTLRLGGGVDFALMPENSIPGASEDAGQIRASSESASCVDGMRRIVFEGKARIESGGGTLSGKRIELFLSEDQKKITKLTAAGSCAYRSENPNDSWLLTGDRMAFEIGEMEALENIRVNEQALFSSRSSIRDLELRAGEIVLGFDEAGQWPAGIQSRTDVKFEIKSAESRTRISGDQLEAGLQGETKSVEDLCVRGRAVFSAGDPRDAPGNELRADEIRLNFLRKDGRSIMEKLLAAGSARWSSVSRNQGPETPPASVRVLSASRLQMIYSSDGDYVESGSAGGNVTITEEREDESGRSPRRSLQADSALFHFYPHRNQIKDIYAEGRVKVEQKQQIASKGNPKAEPFRATGEKMRALFSIRDNESAIRSAALWGDFRFESASWNGTAGRSEYSAEKGIMMLQESPEISDATGVTTGEEIRYDQERKVLSVHKAVRSRLNSGRDGNTLFGVAPSSSSAIIASDEMLYWTDDERMHYTGGVQLLSESQQLQAQELEIFGGGEQIKARGDVLHRIERVSEKEGSRKSFNSGKEKNAADSLNSPIVVRSENVRFSKKDNSIKYTGDVRITSDDLDLSSESFSAFLNSETNDIERASAKGNVIARRGGNECHGDTAEWRLNSGKLVVHGNPAEFYDPSRGRSKAGRLTFNTTDDTIQLSGPKGR